MALDPLQAELVRDLAELMLRVSDAAAAVARRDPAEACRHLAAVELALPRITRRAVDLDGVTYSDPHYL